jgi:hypothetical protein
MADFPWWRAGCGRWRLYSTICICIGESDMANPGRSWRVEGAGDFNGDGNADILWQNDDGTPAIWLMNGTSFIGGGGLGNPGPSWHVAGANRVRRQHADRAGQRQLAPDPRRPTKRFA